MPEDQRGVCAREGCGKKLKRQGHTTCSGICKSVVHEMDRAQRICEATRDTEHWFAAVTLNDSLTDFFRSDRRMYLAARAKGVSDADWRYICDGG